MHIGILQTGHAPDELRPDVGDFSDLFQTLLSGHGFTFHVFNVVDMDFPASKTACDGWLITGSKHGAYEDHPFIPPLEKLIQEIFAADIPLVGVCFGHQIIAQALGGKVEKFADGWAVGRQIYDLNGTEIALNAWHQDQVTTAPESATVVGSNPFCANAALLYDRRAFTIQPHPEFTAPVVDGLVKYRGPGNVPDAQLAEVAANLDKPNDSALIAAQIAHFFKERHLE
ncbi:type 1 glutamine amidotransferase [Loktanella sp. S4079]|uniref:type 1 glutamine amidotransferase n=1 Tax=Loktanella sp. S4079 TaxID=579483 RepID=UPI0005F9B2AB|nr:type 1 glutamine amidotransferase [Loktanella sp. S4079]KJZ20563.1 glutamine amidotransferase [Loktanella sp. S4079]